MYTRIWHARLPIKISFFALRMLRVRLSLDSALCKLGFHLPSRCFCCVNPDIESLDYVFCSGETASWVWNFFGSVCGVVNLGPSVRAYTGGLWYGPRWHKFLEFIPHLLPLLICGHLSKF